MTPNNSALPIPESTVVGTGTYVIPANRYGFLNMTASVSSYSHGYSQNVGCGGGGGGAASNGSQWVLSGDSITTGSSHPTSTTSAATSPVAAEGNSWVFVNGAVNCAASAGAGSSTVSSGGPFYAAAGTAGYVGWSVALFRIPKANLPVGTAEGE